MRSWLILVALLLGSAAHANPCKDLYEQFALFDLKRQAWIEDHKMFLVYCPDDESWKLALREVKGNKELQRLSLTKPGPGARWFFDDGSFKEKPTDGGRNKAILSEPYSHTAEAWAMNPKKRKLEKLAVEKLIPPEPVP